MENSKKSIVSGNLFDKVYSGENYLIKDNKQNKHRCTRGTNKIK